jgi:hypothetical protein
MHIPINQAVPCRNHFVHGGDAGFDYAKEFNSFAFLTETLEFVFAISDILELGWRSRLSADSRAHYELTGE